MPDHPPTFDPIAAAASDALHPMTLPRELHWAKPSHLRPELVVNTLAQLSWREQTMLYALVFALAPERVLEVGVCYGGGLRLIHAALSDLGRGRVVGLDPFPALKVDMNDLADRATLIVGRSPEDLPRAVAAAGGLFDFVFLDGDHRAGPLEADLAGLVGVTHPGSVILMHDAYYEGVVQGLAAAMGRGLPYQDCGLLAHTPNPKTLENGHFGVWAGLRLLRRMEGAPPTPEGPAFTARRGLLARIVSKLIDR